MRDAERMLETAIAVSGGRVSEAEVAATLGVASRSTIYETIAAIINKDAAAALAKVRELHARGANLESLGRDILEALRNLAVARLPASGDTPLSDLPDYEASEIKRLAEVASGRDLMRLFRLMAESAGGAAPLALPRSDNRDGDCQDGDAGAGDRRGRV